MCADRAGRARGSNVSVYGAIVSEPSGEPSSRNVTAAMRPEVAVALAFSVVGCSTLPCEPSSVTDGGPAAVVERRELVARE